jgi:hypothetical protein
MLGDAGAAGIAIERLADERTSSVVLYLMHYLIAVTERLSDEERSRLERNIRALLDDPDTGGDFTVQGSGEAAATHSPGSSMRWGVELTASYLLDLTERDGSAIRQRYDDDERGYARRYSRILAQRLQLETPASPLEAELIA